MPFILNYLKATTKAHSATEITNTNTTEFNNYLTTCYYLPCTVPKQGIQTQQLSCLHKLDGTLK